MNNALARCEFWERILSIPCQQLRQNHDQKEEQDDHQEQQTEYFANRNEQGDPAAQKNQLDLGQAEEPVPGLVNTSGIMV